MGYARSKIVYSVIPGTEKLWSVSTTTTPGVEQTLITATGQSGKKTSFYCLNIFCRFDGKITVLHGSTLIASGRTGPGESNFSFNWIPPFPITGTDSIEVKFLQRPSSPSVDIEAVLQAAEE